MAMTFDDSKPIFSATSPGRLDVMGGIADYSGSLLLQMPIAETTTVELQLRDDHVFHLHSSGKGHHELASTIRYLPEAGHTPESAGSWLRGQSGGDWAAYVVGCFLILQEQVGIPVTGADVRIRSNVPAGKGVSSSAALEVSTMLAVMKAHGLQPDRIKLPLWAQMVENRVAGAACGLMDQLSVTLGKKKNLLPLVCQPHTVGEPVPIPAGMFFAGIDSGVRHAVGGASYGDVRTAAFMAYSIVASEHGLGPGDIAHARSAGTWTALPHGGYLANIPVSQFEQRYAHLLPLQVKGSDFLTRFGGTIDAATEVDPGKHYAVAACARHPVYEQFRVESFARLLRSYAKSRDKVDLLRAMGELMLQGHASYGSVGLGNQRTDEIVAMVRESGPDRGVYGARISGGGSGGTVVVLAAGKEGKVTVREIHERYQRKYGQKVYLFSGSSNGALF